MAYFNSDNVRVFPSTNRYIYPQGKLTSENNFVNILNSITDYNSYVLDYSDNILKVIIHGYYFEINIPNLDSKLPGQGYANYYLGILVETTEYGQLVSWDNNVELDHKEGTNYSFYGLISTINRVPSFAEDAKWVEQLYQNTKYKIFSLQITDSAKNIINRRRLKTDSVYYVQGDRDLSTDLGGRQYKIKAGSGIAGLGGKPGTAISNVFGDNEINIDTREMAKLAGLQGGDEKNPKAVGTDIKFVYFNKDGIAQESKGTVGSGNVTDGSAFKTTDVYLNNGVITVGRTVYASKNKPDENKGKVGDIWLKYQD